MVADVGTLQRLPKLMPLGGRQRAGLHRAPPARAAGARPRSGERGIRHAGRLLEAALQCAAEIAAKPPVAIWGTKQAINYARDHAVDDSLKQMGWLQGAIWSNRARAGVGGVRWSDKRTPTFPPLAPLQSFRERD